MWKAISAAKRLVTKRREPMVAMVAPRCCPARLNRRAELCSREASTILSEPIGTVIAQDDTA